MSGARRTASAALFFSALLGTCSEARAESYRLHWVREPGAESCVSGAALARLLGQVIGPTVESDQPLVAEGRIAPAAPPLRWRMTLRISDARGELVGERELTHAAPHCSALTSSLLLILAMSIDPDAARAGLPPAVVEELRRDRVEDVDVWVGAAHVPDLSLRAPVASTPRDTAPAAEPVATPSKSAESGGTRRWGALFGFAVSSGILPQISPGLAIGAQFAFEPSWSASLNALVWLPRDVALAGPYALADGIEFGAGQVDLRLCRTLLGTDRLHVDACAGGALGTRWVNASALDAQANPWRAYFGPELGVEASMRVGARFFVNGGGTGFASVRRDRFTYVDHAGQIRPLYSPSTFAGWLFFSLGSDL